MNIYFANMFSVKGLEEYLRYKINILASYPSFPKTNKVIPKPPYCAKLFVDSGAFTKDKDSIDIESYANFLKCNEQVIDLYANLDVIGDAKASFKNQIKLENLGLNPLPVFHYGNDIRRLQILLEKYDYIALGGMVPVAGDINALVKWLDKIWDLILSTDANIKVHGFGVQSINIMKRYPWFSVDATSVHIIARYGGIYTPQGTIKINPNVNSREKRWQEMRPRQLNKVAEFAEDHVDNISFEEIRAQNNQGTLARCAISIHYIIELLRNHKSNFKLKNKPLF